MKYLMCLKLGQEMVVVSIRGLGAIILFGARIDMAKRPMTFRFSKKTIQQLKYLQEYWGISGVESVTKALHLTQTAIKRIERRKHEGKQPLHKVYASAIQPKPAYTGNSFIEIVKKKTLGFLRRNNF